MIADIVTAWLYAYSPNKDNPQNTFHTVFLTGPEEQDPNGRAVLAQISLSYLTTITLHGAGALISGYTPPFGPDAKFTDMKNNSMFIPQCLAVTFQLAASAAEAYAVGTIFILT